MTNLNLAFIRAYRARRQSETNDASIVSGDEAPAETIQSTHPPTVPMTSAELYVTHPLRTGGGRPTAASLETAVEPRLGTGAQPAAGVAGSLAGLVRPAAAATAQAHAEVASPLPSGQSASPTKSSPAQPDPFSAGDMAVWKPAWEVDQLQISDCCKFIERHATCLDDVTLRIIASAGTRRNVIPVRSWTRGEGRTTIAVCLARKLAGLGLNVILLDADFDNPSLGPELGINIEHGLDDVLAQRAPLAEACVSSIEDGLSVVPLRGADVDAHNANVQHQLAAIIESLSKHYDMVLIDSGPGSQVWDHGITDRQLGVVVVRDLRRSPSGKTDQLMSNMKRRRTPVLGLIENFSKAA